MPAPLYGADDPRRHTVPAIPYRRCWINSEKLRPDNVATAETKKRKRNFAIVYGFVQRKETRANLPDINPTIPQKATYTHFP